MLEVGVVLGCDQCGDEVRRCLVQRQVFANLGIGADEVSEQERFHRERSVPAFLAWWLDSLLESAAPRVHVSVIGAVGAWARGGTGRRSNAWACDSSRLGEVEGGGRGPDPRGEGPPGVRGLVGLVLFRQRGRLGFDGLPARPGNDAERSAEAEYEQRRKPKCGPRPRAAATQPRCRRWERCRIRSATQRPSRRSCHQSR